MKNKSCNPSTKTPAPAARFSFTARRSRPLGRALVGAFLSLCLALAAQAATLTVTNDRDDDSAGSLRVVLSAAADGDNVVFSNSAADGAVNFYDGAAHTITLRGSYQGNNGAYIQLANSVSLTGPGADKLTIDANRASRIFLIESTATLAITGLTLANGHAGSLNGDSGPLQYFGGAILSFGTLSVTNCVLRDSIATNFGGGISVQAGSLISRNNFYTGNQTYFMGAAINLISGTLDSAGDAISGSQGVAIRQIGGTSTFTGCTISGNYGYAYGGGFNLYGGLATLRNCTISFNTAAYGGGGIYISNSAVMNILSTTVTGNYLRIDGEGGGIHSFSNGVLYVTDSIVSGNRNGDLFGSLSTNNHNLIGGDPTTILEGTIGTLPHLYYSDGQGFIPNLANNGGSVATIALIPGSPAIDAGDPAFDVSSLPYDARGFQRVANGRIDIGAVESGSYLNLAPVAVPGANATAHAGTVVNLNGAASYDDNTPGPALAYSWSLISKPAGSTAALNNANTATPSFTPDRVGDYQVQLIVIDNGYPALSSAPAFVTFSSYNQAPTGAASASPTLPVVGQTVSLKSTGTSDPENDALSYQWVLTGKPTGSTAQIVSPTAATASIVPDVPGTYSVTLTPSDFLGAGTPATASFTASSTQSYIEQKLRDAATFAEGLPANQVTSKGNQKDFVKLLQKALKDAQHGRYSKAIKSVESATIRTDGIPLRGTIDASGNSRDWILSASAQQQLYACLVEVRNGLNGLRPDNDDHQDDDGD